MNLHFKKTIMILIIFLVAINISACWDNKDIVDRAIVSAVGLDLNESGQVELTLQVLRPNIIRAKQEGGSDESSIWVSTTTGDTIFDAARNQLQTINRKPFYGHLKIIAIGEELARAGIKDVLDFFVRDHEMKVIPKLIVTKGVKAKDVLNAESKIENIPAMHIEGIFENNMAEAKTRDITLLDILKEASSSIPNFVIGNMITTNIDKPMEIKNIKVEGASLFKDDKLIGFLDDKETRGYLFIRNEIEGGIINVPNPNDSNKKLAIELKHSKSKIDVNIKNDKLVPSIKVEIRGVIGEHQGSGNIATQETLEEVEVKMIEEVKSNIRDVLEVSQEKYKVEFFGFADSLSSKYPDYWEEIKNNWNEEFSKLSVEITVKAEIDKTGLITTPLFFE